MSNSCTDLIVRADPCFVCFMPTTSEDVKVPLCHHKCHAICLAKLKEYGDECPRCHEKGNYNPYAYLVNPSKIKHMSPIERGVFLKFVERMRPEATKEDRILLTFEIAERAIREMLLDSRSGLNANEFVVLGILASSLGLAKFVGEQILKKQGMSKKESVL